jgi:hypothetical protein
MPKKTGAKKATAADLHCAQPPSSPLEHPDIVLVSTATTDLFNGSKTASLVEQFVAKRHYPPRLAIL